MLDPMAIADQCDIRIVEDLNMHLMTLQLSCMKKRKLANFKLKSRQ
jgi:hypothetical protein